MIRHRLRVVLAAAGTAVLLTTGPNLVVASATTVVSTDTPVTVDAPYVKANGRTAVPGRRHHCVRAKPAAAERALHGRRRRERPRSWSPGRTTTAPSSLPAAPGRASTAAPTQEPTWIDSLLPGYPTDTSPEGLASPLQQRGITNAGDPVQAWDLQGRLFYMGNAFNRARTAERLGLGGNIRPGRRPLRPHRHRGQGRAGAERPLQRQDLDRGRPRREQPVSGQCLRRVEPVPGHSGNNSIQFVRSTDHGATFSKPAKISTGSKDVQFADIAVTSNGTVYVAYRQFETNGGTRRRRFSTSCPPTAAQHSARPATAATFEPFDAADFAGDPDAAEAAHEQAYEQRRRTRVGGGRRIRR